MGRASCKHDSPGSSALNLTQLCQKCFEEATQEVIEGSVLMLECKHGIDSLRSCISCNRVRAVSASGHIRVTSICKHRKNEEICTVCREEFAEWQATQPTFNKPSHKDLTWIYLKEYAEEVVVHLDPHLMIPVTKYNSGVHVTPEQDHLPEACYLLRKEATKTEVNGKPTLATLHVCTEHVVVVDWTAY